MARTGATVDQSATFRAGLTFEVVSIRPTPVSQDLQMIGLPSGNEYRAMGMPLANTIVLAYFPWRSLFQSQLPLSDAPKWVWTDRYNFVGKVSEADIQQWQKFRGQGRAATNPMLQSMLQSALADRCKLVVHRVPVKVDGYALVVAKQKPDNKNLVPAKPDDAVPTNAINISYGGRMIPIHSPDEPVLRFFQTSMLSLAAMMSDWGVPVDDRTGLTGQYNFPITRLSTEGDPSVDWELAPLGLKLVPVKIDSEIVVIDHIERPTSN